MLLNLVSKVIHKSTSLAGLDQPEPQSSKGSLGGLNSKLDIGLASLVDLSKICFSVEGFSTSGNLLVDPGT